jgi:hypothetical protein
VVASPPKTVALFVTKVESSVSFNTPLRLNLTLVQHGEAIRFGCATSNSARRDTHRTADRKLLTPNRIQRQAQRKKAELDDQLSFGKNRFQTQPSF